MKRRKILLLEPNYKNKYPPMGLMKLATYFRERGDDVRFFKGNLKDFAAKILCEKFFAEVKNTALAKYEQNFFQFIKTGKFVHIESIPDFFFSNDDVILRQFRQQFVKGIFPKFDVICITTLFTFYWKETINTINFAKQFLNRNGKIHIGGIAATILPDEIYKATGIKPIVGQLNKKRMIDADSNVIIDNLPLDYSILEEIDYKYPASNAYFAYMTRGCPNKCTFCAVPRLEPTYHDYIPLKKQLETAAELYGEQKDLLLLDNNIFASKKFNLIIDEIKECGFAKDAKYTPPNEYEIALQHLRAAKNENHNVRAYGRKIIALYDKLAEKLPPKEQGEFYLAREQENLLYPAYATPKAILAFERKHNILSSYTKYFPPKQRVRYIDFNQGVDARLCTEEKIKKLAEVNIRPLRIAFDHYSMKDIYCNAVRLAAKHGIKHLSNYILYNYKDTPDEFYQRLRINIDLCEELHIAIYSFPMKYHPIDDPQYFDNRDYIGKHWNRKFIRSVQAVLNSTAGKIGRGKSFFEKAFGRNLEEFYDILWMPEAFIIHRLKYEDNKTADWRKQFNALSKEQCQEAKAIIAANNFTAIDQVKNKKVQKVLEFYLIKKD